MNIDIKSLVALANDLDSRGFAKEADMCDDILKKIAKPKVNTSGTPPTYFIKAINEYRQASFVYDVKSRRYFSDQKWKNPAFRVKYPQSVVVTCVGVEAIFADPNKAYRIIENGNGYIPGIVNVNFKDSSKSPKCEYIEKYVILEIDGSGRDFKENDSFLRGDAKVERNKALNEMNKHMINGRIAPIILKMKADSFERIYRADDNDGWENFKTMIEGSESEQASLVNVQDLQEHTDDCNSMQGASSAESSTEESSMNIGEDEGNNPSGATFETDTANNTTNSEDSATNEGQADNNTVDSSQSSSSDLKVISRAGVVFYSNGTKVTNATKSFALLGGNKSFTDNDSTVLMNNIFNNSTYASSIEKYTALNKLAMKLKNVGVDQSNESDDRMMSQEDKIASEFLRRLNNIKKIADGADNPYKGYEFFASSKSSFLWKNRSIEVHGIKVSDNSKVKVGDIGPSGFAPSVGDIPNAIIDKIDEVSAP